MDNPSASASPADNTNYDGLKERIKLRLQEEIRRIPEYMFERAEDIQLEELPEDRLHDLFLGKIDSVTNEWYDNDSDYNYNLDRECIKEQLTALIDNEFIGAVDEFADAHDCDNDDVTQRLLDDDDFSPSELEMSGNYTRYEYKGKCAAYAEIMTSGGFTPDGTLFDMLQTLRITPTSFLDAMRDFIAKKDHTERNEVLVGSIINPINIEDIGVSEEYRDIAVSHGVFHAYKFAFNEALLQSTATALYSFDFDHPPVVDVNALLESIDRWGYGSSLYVQTVFDSSTIETIGIPLQMHFDGHLDGMSILVKSAHISESSEPGIDNSCLEMLSGLEVPIGNFKVLSTRPDRATTGVFALNDEVRGKCETYKIGYGDSKIHALPIDKVDWASVSTQIDRAINDVPLWKLEEVRSDYPSNPGLITGRKMNSTQAKILEMISEALERRSLIPLSPDGLGRELLLSLQDSRIASKNKQKIEWLIDNGASLDLLSSSGYTAAHLAAHCRDLSIVTKLFHKGADFSKINTPKNVISYDKEFESRTNSWVANPLSIVTRYLIDFSDGPLQRSVAEFLVSNGMKLPEGKLFTRYTEELGNQGNLVYSIRSGLVRLVESQIESVDVRSEAGKRSLNVALVEAGIRKNVPIGSLLIKAGADLDIEYKLKAGRSGTIEEKLTEHYTRHSQELESQTDAVAFINFIKAARAKQAVHKMLETMKPRLSP